MKRRLAWVAPALAVAALSSCTFSTGESTDVTVSGQAGGQDAGQVAGRDAHDGSRSSGGGTGAGSGGSLCDRLTAVYLGDLSDTRDPASVVEDWAKVTASAPASLRPDLETVGGYLRSAARKDYAALKASARTVDAALDHVDAYVARECHA